MDASNGRRKPVRLSAETKWEIFLAIAQGEVSQAEAMMVPETVRLLCLSTRELGEVPLVAFGEVAVVVEAPFEC